MTAWGLGIVVSMAGNEVYPGDREFLTIPDAARLLGISVKTLRREAQVGSFPTYSPGGKRRRVRLVDIIEWVHSTLVAPSTAKASAHAEAVVDAFLAREKATESRRRRATSHRQDNPE